MNHAFLAARQAARQYENPSYLADEKTIPDIKMTLDGETIGRIAAPTVSRILAENLRRQRFLPQN